MIATTEEQRLLEKWQKKLCLQVEWIVTEALAHGNKVVINADW